VSPGAIRPRAHPDALAEMVAEIFVTDARAIGSTGETT
jgi:hypothetical protein